MSTVLLLTYILQVIVSNVRKVNSICATFAILLHFGHLTTFAWMAVISLDLFLTFNFPGQVSLDVKRRRFALYNYVSFGMPMVLVLFCILLEYVGESHIGYGRHGLCFIVNIWAYLFAFVVPIGILLVFNIICLVCTIRKIYITQKRIRHALSKAKSSWRGNLHLVIMTLKISSLTGLGWILMFIAATTKSAILSDISLFLIFYQGVFIFVGFFCTRKVLELYMRRLTSFRQRMSLRCLSQDQETKV